jgi:2,3-bisphosphoglycerate-independent phosphoglycerate mutase
LRALVVVCDGLADRPLREGGLTPLERAETPQMDRIAEEGICGLMDPIAPGITPGSDTAHLSLLGYDPFQTYSGRGPFEAAGAGLPLRKGDVAFRVNFATVDENLLLRDRRAGRLRDGRELEELLRGIRVEGAEILFRSTSSHRAVLVLRGKGLSHQVSSNDPHTTGVRVEGVRPLSAAGRKTARILNEFLRKAREVLEEAPLNRRRREQGLPPANYLLVRGGGTVPSLEPLESRFSLRGACVAAAALVRGVCRLAGMEVAEVPTSTTGVDTDLEAEVAEVERRLEESDLVLYSIKGFDEVSHDGDARRKIEFIERFDGYLPRLREMADFLVLTADHSTPVEVREHTADPVPVVIAGPGVRTDEVRRFGERSCARGGLGRIKGTELLPILVDLMGRSRKFGA